MSVPLDIALRRIGEALSDRVVPALEDGFAIETARLANMLLTMSANAIEDAAALRVDENAAMRGLFADSAAVVADSAFAARLSQAAGSRDPGLKISELDAENGRLRTLLVALHAQVETQSDAKALAVAQRIWRMLRDFEARRAPRL